MANRPVTYLPPDAGTASWVLGELIIYKVRAERGDGCTIFEDVTMPGGGPPPHIHHTQDETIYVLQGELEFSADGRVIAGVPGTVLHVPHGQVHTFKNVGAGPARTLATVTPPGDLEAFFDEVGEPATDRSHPPVPGGPPDIDKIMASARRHHFEVVLPQEVLV